VQANGFFSSLELIDRFGNGDQSHIRHINTILRSNAVWLSGVDQTVSRVIQALAVDDIFIALTSGIIRDLHDNTFPAFSHNILQMTLPLPLNQLLI